MIKQGSELTLHELFLATLYTQVDYKFTIPSMWGPAVVYDKIHYPKADHTEYLFVSTEGNTAYKRDSFIQCDKRVKITSIIWG